MKKVLKTLLIVSSMVVASALVGCGSETGATKAEENTFKSGAKPTVNIPPGSNQAPSDFKSSLDTGGGPRPPAGAGAPGPGN